MVTERIKDSDFIGELVSPFDLWPGEDALTLPELVQYFAKKKVLGNDPADVQKLLDPRTNIVIDSLSTDRS